MVVSRAPAWHVRVADFGISMRLTDQSTVTVVHRGTLGYAAPEVIVSTDHPCSPADMWSLGCVVHKILTGTPPFTTLLDLFRFYSGMSEFPRDHLLSCKVSDYGRHFVMKLLQV